MTRGKSIPAVFQRPSWAAKGAHTAWGVIEDSVVWESADRGENGQHAVIARMDVRDLKTGVVDTGVEIIEVGAWRADIDIDEDPSKGARDLAALLVKMADEYDLAMAH